LKTVKCCKPISFEKFEYCKTIQKFSTFLALLPQRKFCFPSQKKSAIGQHWVDLLLLWLSLVFILYN